MPENRSINSHHEPPVMRTRACVCTLLASAAALFVVITGTAASAPSVVHAASPAAFSRQAVKPPPTIWGACPSVNRAAAEQKVVRRFDRATGAARGVVPMPAGTSNLLCGTGNFGFYHIVAEHYVEWTQKSVKTNENWKEVADYSIAEALRNPTAVTFRPANNTFCYSRQVSLIDKVRGITVDVMYPNVVVRAKDGAIITAFPAGRPC